ncbi:TPA: bacteriocin-associated protein, partial [Bacillus cereus]|nr:bacteriocin-associated protein [Bacillus cereus]
MKKILFSLYIAIFLLSFFVFVKWISSEQQDVMKQAGKENGIVITFNESILEINHDKFFSVLFTESERYSANIFKPSYSEDSLTEYIYLTHDLSSYFSNFSLLDGDFPHDTKSEMFYLSTLNNKKTTGELFSYTKENNFNIKPLKSYSEDKLLTGNYIFVLEDANKIDSFVSGL